MFVALIENLPTIIVEIVKAVPQIISALVDAFGSLFGKMADVGMNLVKGLWSGIQSLASWLWDKVSGWISGIWDGIKDFFGISSPSKEMAWVGDMLVKGLAGSINKNGKEAVQAAAGMSEAIAGVMQDLSGEMETAVPHDFNINGSLQVPDTSSALGVAPGFQLKVEIANFNNYSREDIESLTNEVLLTAERFMKRKGAAFA